MERCRDALVVVVVDVKRKLWKSKESAGMIIKVDRIVLIGVIEDVTATSSEAEVVAVVRGRRKTRESLYCWQGWSIGIG